MATRDVIASAWEFLNGSSTIIGLPEPFTLDTSVFSGSSAATIVVKEGGGITEAFTDTLDFDASDFTLTNTPDGEVNISLAYGTTAGTPAEGNHSHSFASYGLDPDLASFALPPNTTVSTYGQTLVDDPTEAQARITLGLAPGGAGDIWVYRSGDTMTGDLTIAPLVGNADLTLTATISTITMTSAGDSRAIVSDGTGIHIDDIAGPALEFWETPYFIRAKHNLDVEGTGAFSGDVTVPDEAYGSGWNASLEVPTKNAVYDKIEAMPNTAIVNVGVLTIASGIITLPAITNRASVGVINVEVETEGGAASDLLDRIESTPTGSNIFTEGTLLVLRPTNGAHVVTVTTRTIANTPATSNVLLQTLQPRPLSWFQSALLLSYYQGTWIEVGYHHPVIGWTVNAAQTALIGNAQSVAVDLIYQGLLDANLLVVKAATSDRVGIGVASPTVKLDVLGDGKFTQGLTAESLTLLGSSTVGSDYPRLTFYDTTGPANGKYWWINHYKDAVEFAALDDSQVAWAVWLHASRSGLTVPQVTVNYTGGDTDFNVKGDTDTNLFYTDASTDRIGIGTATPAEKLDVVGNIAVSGVLQFPGTANPMINLAGTAYGIGIAAAQNQYFVDTTGRHSFRTGGYDGTQIALLGFDGIVLNQSGADLDTKISGDTDVNLFYADASADSIGIGTSTPSSWFDLKAGTTARAPLRFPSGTNLTTPLAGTVEYDGNVFYVSNAASARGLLPSRHHARIDAGRNLVDDTSNQAIFPSSDDALTVIAGATYRFRWVCQLTKGTNNVATSVLFGGTATFTTIQYVSLGVTATTGSAQTPAMNNGTAATSTNVAIAGTGANVRFLVEGEFEVNGAGTIIPQVTFSGATGSTPTVNIGTFFECWRIGANPVTTIGPWA